MGHIWAASFHKASAAATSFPSIQTISPLPNAANGVAYSIQLFAIGGYPPYTWAVLSSSGSNSWSISGQNLTGTPATAETDIVTISVTDSHGQSPNPVQLSLTVTGSVNGYDGSLVINSVGKVTNGHGVPIMLRGFNTPGLDGQILGGVFTGNRYWAADPWGSTGPAGGYATGLGGPPYPAIALWNPNLIRMQITPQAFLNLTVALPVWGGSVAASTFGTTDVGDPLGIYKQTIITAIKAMRGINTYIIIGGGSGAPAFTLGGVTHYIAAVNQPPALDWDTGSVYWFDPVLSLPVWLANNFGSAAFNAANGFNGGAAGAYYDPAHGGSTGIGDFIFEIMNEPYTGNQAFTLYMKNADGSQSSTQPPASPGLNGNLTYTQGNEYVLLNGGWCSWFYQQGATQAIPAQFTNPPNVSPPSAGGNLAGALALPWRIIGYQEATNGIRALGFPNIILCHTDGFCQSQQSIPYLVPVDPQPTNWSGGTWNPQIAFAWHAYPTAENSNTSVPICIDQSTLNSSTWHIYSDELLAGTLNPGTPSWSTGWSVGRVLPLFFDEWGDASGTGALQPNQYVNALTAYFDSKPIGLCHSAIYAWDGVAPNNIAAGTYTQWFVAILGPSITFTGAINNGTVGQAGQIMTVTGTPSAPIQAGMQLIGGSNNGTYVAAFGTNGTTGAGGAGTYWVSVSQSVGNTTITAGLPGPWQGNGLTYYGWIQPHG
jgi:hypothetical protein